MFKSLIQDRKSRTYIILAAFIIAIFIFGIYQHHINKEVQAYTEILTQYEERFSQYYYKDFEDTYNTLIGNFQTGLDRKDLSLLKSCCNELDELETAVIEANTVKYEKKIKKLQQTDLTNAYENELVQLEHLQSEVQTKMDHHQFKDAAALIKKWSKLIKNMSFVADNLSIYVKQIDTSQYPMVSLYLSIHNIETDEVPIDLEKSYCFLNEIPVSTKKKSPSFNGNSVAMEQLDNNLPLSITIAADMGNSKTEKEHSKITASISAFLDNVQFNVKDQIEIVSITNNLTVNQELTSDKEALFSALSDLKATKNATHFYDGLMEAITRASTNSGAKCVIAFTDNEDTMSTYEWKDVVALANQYSIPVYVIGIGDEVSPYVLERIGVQTNGSYRNINDFSSLGKSFETIYEEMKSLYKIQYQSGLKKKPNKERVLNISYEHRLYGGSCEYSYSILKKADN